MESKLNKMKTYQKILSGIIIGILSVPTIAMGGSIVNSLIHGKSVPEAIQILAEQIDLILARLEIIETKQVKQEQSIEELQTELFSIKNKEVCDKLDSFERQLDSFEKQIPNLINLISEIEQNYIQTNNYCQPFTANISQECLSFRYGDPGDLECCYKYAPPENYSDYPQGYPKTCCSFFYNGKFERDQSIAITQKQLDDAQKQLDELLSNPEYLQVKEQCIK